MDVSEACSDTEILPNLAESLVYVPDILGLGVQAGVVHTSVVHTILLTAGNTDLHLEPESKRHHALEIFDTGRDVFPFGFFGEVKHVRGEERNLVLFVVFLVGGKHTVKPFEKLVGTVITVEDDRAGCNSESNPILPDETEGDLTRRKPWLPLGYGGRLQWRP
jgi:hypothetical protein